MLAKAPAAAKGVKGESPCGAWGSAPKPDAEAFTEKRANSPKGYEASDSGAWLGLMKSIPAAAPCIGGFHVPFGGNIVKSIA